MKHSFKILLAAVALCLCSPLAQAEQITWDTPGSAAQPTSIAPPVTAPVATTGGHHHQKTNINFEGTAMLNKEDTRRLQQALADKGFYKGAPDGVWGGETSQALLDYQGAHEQPLTGTATKSTLRELGVTLTGKY